MMKLDTRLLGAGFGHEFAYSDDIWLVHANETQTKHPARR